MKVTALGAAALCLMSVTALGADLGLPAPLVPLAFTWTGCYAGVQAGGGFGQKDLNDSAGIVSPITGFTSTNQNISGYMLGGQIGCDYQFASNWIVGIEGTATGGRIGGSTTVVQPLAIPGDGASFKETTDFLGTATARVGYAWDRWLVYGKVAPHGRATDIVRQGHFLGPRLTLKVWRRDLVGPLARASNGHSQIIGRSSSNMTTTALAHAASRLSTTSAALLGRSTSSRIFKSSCSG